MAALGVDGTPVSGSTATTAGPALPPDIAWALPTLAEMHDTRPGALDRLKVAARSWTTVAGLKHHTLSAVHGYAGPFVRRAQGRGAARWVEHLPVGLRARFQFDGQVVDPLRVEIGGGDHPSPGYVHVDVDRKAAHVEHVAPGSALPFGDATVEELLAIHILEHVHPSSLLATLCEWRRVLCPGGFAQIHVPNAATVFAAFLDSPPERKWTVMIPIFGMTSHAKFGTSDDRDYERHHAIYDFALLERVLLEAGFARVEDVSTEVTDRHTEKWRDDQLIPRMSLVVRAYAG